MRRMAGVRSPQECRPISNRRGSLGASASGGCLVLSERERDALLGFSSRALLESLCKPKDSVVSGKLAARILARATPALSGSSSVATARGLCGGFLTKRAQLPHLHKSLGLEPVSAALLSWTPAVEETRSPCTRPSLFLVCSSSVGGSLHSFVSSCSAFAFAESARAELASTAITRSPCTNPSTCARWPWPAPRSTTTSALTASATFATSWAIRLTSCCFFGGMPSCKRFSNPRRLCMGFSHCTSGLRCRDSSLHLAMNVFSPTGQWDGTLPAGTSCSSCIDNLDSDSNHSRSTHAQIFLSKKWARCPSQSD
mmetsp:Transcript_19433/g.37215  ORF Transcript_19433/g.37215 Transcript_19433/m.37215 type:complete len:312 (-) Transcript_19433:58-993(-)